MKPLLNTLYVTSPGASLAKEGETVCVKQEGETRARIPLHTLTGIICFGPVGCSPFLMHAASERGVALTFLSEHGRFLARVQGPVSGNVLLRRAQYRRADAPVQCGELVRSFVLGKIVNSRAVLQRAARSCSDAGGTDKLNRACGRLVFLCKEVARCRDVDVIRGHEGDAARVYFSVFDELIVGDREQFFFHGRNRRPPLDNVNCLLSFLYTLLTHDVASALEAVGLDPAVGFLHRDRPGRPSLALDLVEELRSPLADRLALALINRRQVNASGFRHSETGGVVMDDDTRKQVLTAWQARKAEEVLHPFLREKVPIGLLCHVQAMLLARMVRGELPAYPCYFWR
jgi:CRISPR-associated protein Cas1